MYILDTCAFIWTMQNDAKVSPKVLDILSGYDEIYISQATLWEIAIKQTLGKIALTESIFELEKLCNSEDVGILPLKVSYFERIKRLPMIHGDPFDRIIIATALEEDMTLLTCDKAILKYEALRTLW